MDLLNATTSNEQAEAEFPREDVYNDLGDIWNWAYVLVAAIWFIIGVPGNCMIIAACAIFKEMHTIPMALAANLALSDLLVCLMNVASTWLAFFYDRAVMLKYPILCTFNGYVCGMGCVCSIASICSIAINRYVAICHNSIYTKIYNMMTFPLHLLASWLAGLVIISPAVIEFQGAHFKYDRRQIICARSYLVETGYQPIQWWETVLIVPISTSTMLFTYSRIFSKVHQSSKNLQRGNKTDEAPTFTPRDIQLLKTLLVMFIIFITGNLPWFVLMSFDFNDQAPHSLYYIAVWTIHSASVLNPVIYAAKYPLFQEAFKKILRSVSCGLCFGADSAGGSATRSASTRAASEALK